MELGWERSSSDLHFMLSRFSARYTQGGSGGYLVHGDTSRKFGRMQIRSDGWLY